MPNSAARREKRILFFGLWQISGEAENSENANNRIQWETSWPSPITFPRLAQNANDQNVGRTIRFSNTNFQNVLYEWNLLDHGIKNSKSISEIKQNVLAIIRPNTSKTFKNILRPPTSKANDAFDIEGIKKLTIYVCMYHLPHTKYLQVIIIDIKKIQYNTLRLKT